MRQDYISRHKPSGTKRLKGCGNGEENHFAEAAVMIAFAMHIMGEGATCVEIHPDGEHGKRFDMRRFIESLGFVLKNPRGKTAYGGEYQRGKQSIIISIKPGEGDVRANLGDKILLAECKGGVTNSRHAGLVARLRRGLCEAVGLLMARPLDRERERHVAVVPATEATEKLARRMNARSARAGIEIALVHEDGTVQFLDAP